MRSFTKKYTKLFEKSKLSDQGFGVIMIDLDKFKSVNDNNNHLVGSFVIAEVERIIGRACEDVSGAIPARYGGDEYIIAIPCQPHKNQWH